MICYPLTRLKNCLSKPLTYGLNEPAVEDNPEWPRYIRITDFDDNDCLREETFKSLPPEIAEAGLLKKGDILLARSGATVGKAFHFNEDIKACYAGYLIRARLNEKTIIPKFFSYITKSVYYSDWKNRINIQATIQNISAEKYYQFEFPCPQLEIQQRIVDYLDEKTKAIDGRISVLEKKSDAYTRLKASVINRAVTRGLNPNVTLKDSGIEWIGMIPEHWEVKRVKDLCTINRATLNESTSANYEFKYIDISGVTKGDITLSETMSFWEAPSRARRIVHKDDIIVSTVRTYLRAIAHIDWDAKDIIASTGFAVISPLKEINPRFLSFVFNYDHLVDEICRRSCGVSYPATTAANISTLSLPIPPLSEQKEISDYLDTKCSEIDKAIDNIGKQIDALKRLKRSLINEVVTGKRKI